MAMYSPTAIEQAPATRLASPAGARPRVCRRPHHAENQGDVRDQAVVDAEHRGAAVPLWTLTASSTCSATPSTLDCGFAESMSSLRAYALALLQSETVVPSRADCAAASTTARARTPSAAGTGFGARPAHASRKAWSSTRSGSSRAGWKLFLPRLHRFPDSVPLEMLAQVQCGRPTSRNRRPGRPARRRSRTRARSRERNSSPRRLWECRRSARRSGQIVEPATQIVALNRA